MSASATFLRPAEHPDGPSTDNRRRRRLVLVLAAVVVVVIVLTWVVAFSSVLGVRSVVVKGTHVLTTTEVDQAAGIATGTPLVRLDTAAVTRRLERLAVVDSAQVSTSYPSTVVITVVERIPVGYVRVRGRDLLVDRAGHQYRAVVTAPSALPRFVVPDGPGSRATGTAVATVAAALPRALLGKVDSIQALDAQTVTLLLHGGRIVRWGSADRSADKAQILPTLLKSSDSQIDVSNPDQPFTH